MQAESMQSPSTLGDSVRISSLVGSFSDPLPSLWLSALTGRSEYKEHAERPLRLCRNRGLAGHVAGRLNQQIANYIRGKCWR